jgi:hypothetical protein
MLSEEPLAPDTGEPAEEIAQPLDHARQAAPEEQAT